MMTAISSSSAVVVNAATGIAVCPIVHWSLPVLFV
jgi:hypothetical protein